MCNKSIFVLCSSILQRHWNLSKVIEPKLSLVNVNRKHICKLKRFIFLDANLGIFGTKALCIHLSLQIIKQTSKTMGRAKVNLLIRMVEESIPE